MQKYNPLNAFLRLHPAPSALPATAFQLSIVIFKSVLIFSKKIKKKSKKNQKKIKKRLAFFFLVCYNN